MRYANLRFALGQVKLAHYQLAQLLGLSESALSRKLTGRREFTADERARIAELLAARGASMDQGWLFSELTPPRARREDVHAPAHGDGR